MLNVKNISFGEDGKVRQMVSVCCLPNIYDFKEGDKELECDCPACMIRRKFE